VTVEAYTAMHDRDGAPSLGILAGLTPGGARAWANTHDPDLLAALVTDDLVGHPAHFHAATASLP
jgi:hypothetical protein